MLYLISIFLYKELSNYIKYSLFYKVYKNEYIKEEQKIILHRAILKLKPQYRQVLWLVYFEDFKIREVAKIMHKSVHNAEVLVYRARQALKSQLEKEGFVYEEL